MSAVSVRGWGALALLSVFTGFTATYAWQSRTPAPAQQSSNPAEVLGGWLRLLPGEIEQLRQVDPAFSTERVRLEHTLATERERLADLFGHEGFGDAEVLEQVERTIAAHDALERRVAKYLLSIRPHLSGEQRTRLFERCASGVREAGGGRWRFGQPGNDSTGRRGGGPPADRGFGRGRGRGPASPATGTTQPGSQPAGVSP